MSDVKLQDWPEGKRLRITYCHGKEEPRAITSYAGKWHFFEPVRVEIEPHPEGFYIPARDYDRQAAEITRLRAALATARREAMEEVRAIFNDAIENTPLEGTLLMRQIDAAIHAAAKEDRPSEEIIREDRDAWPDHQANDPIRAAAKEEK